MQNPKAKTAVTVGGKQVKPGQEIDPAALSPRRLAKMREAGKVEAAPHNRAEEGGRPTTAIFPPKVEKT